MPIELKITYKCFFRICESKWSVINFNKCGFAIQFTKPYDMPRVMSVCCVAVRWRYRALITSGCLGHRSSCRCQNHLCRTTTDLNRSTITSNTISNYADTIHTNFNFNYKYTHKTPENSTKVKLRCVCTSNHAHGWTVSLKLHHK